MSLWNTLEPTPKQIEAIKSYEKYYRIKIHYKSKQDAHDLISVFVKSRRLILSNGIIEGTNLKYDVISSSKSNDLLLLESLNNNMGRLMTEVSYSDFEDSLGYLDEETLEFERNLYGPNPMWWQ